MKQKTYRSKIDLWLVALIAVVIIWPLLFNFSWKIAFIEMLVLLVCIYAISSIKYTIDDHTLTVKCGFFSTSTYEIMEITKIKKTHNPLSAPAASIDRIAIYLKKRRVPLILSPRNKEEFINELVKRNANIVI